MILGAIILGATLGMACAWSLLSFINRKHQIGQCSICFEEMEIYQGLDILPCNHTFHERCIDTWYFTRIKEGHSFNSIPCPLCRKECRVKCIMINFIPVLIKE